MRATAADTAQRIDTIVGMMQRDEWRTSVQSQLAADWGVKASYVERLAIEAGRRVVFLAQLTADPERLKVDVASVLMRSLHAAHDEKSRGDVARIGDIVTKITGARSPDKIDLNVRQYEELAPGAMLARLRDQRAKLDEAIAKLEADHPELVVPFAGVNREPNPPRLSDQVAPIDGLVDSGITVQGENGPIKVFTRAPRPGETT